MWHYLGKNARGFLYKFLFFLAIKGRVLFIALVILGQAKLEPRIQGMEAMFLSLSAMQLYYH
jgi:hypothetical protein